MTRKAAPQKKTLFMGASRITDGHLDTQALKYANFSAREQAATLEPSLK
jgi:hypothetical protein